MRICNLPLGEKVNKGVYNGTLVYYQKAEGLKKKVDAVL